MVLLQSRTESGLLLVTLLRAGMDRFLPSASGSSAAGLKPCCEPTCKFKSQLLTSVQQCPCGGCMHEFCGRGQNNICSIQKAQHRTQQSHQSATTAEHRCLTKTSFSNTPFAVQQVQFGRSRGGGLSLPKKNGTFNHLQRCGDRFFGVFVTC